MQARLGRGLAAVLALVFAAVAAAEERTLVIFHTNDIHGHILPSIDFDYPGEPKPRLGGFARLSGVVREARARAEKAGHGFLLLDAGDIFDGTPEGLETRGLGIVELMNQVGYDGMAVGNHEFAHGVEAVRALAQAAKFPWLACNIVLEEGGVLADFAKPYLVKEAGGLKVAIVGVTTPSTPEMNFDENCAGVRFLPYVDRVARCVEFLRAQVKPDVIVVLSHIGTQADAALAREVDVPVIVGGHDHVTLEAGMRRGNSLICQTGDHLRRVGRIELVYDTVKQAVVRVEASLINLGGEGPEPDPAMAAKVEEVRSEAYDEVVGRCDVSCVQGRDQESRVGNLVTDAMCGQTGAQVGIMNSGGVRSNLLRGPVTRRDLFEITPFPDPVRVYTIPGNELLSLLESGVPPTGGYKYEVAGLAFTVNLREREGRRVKNVKVGQVTLKEDDSYPVAISSFFAQHGARRAFFAGKPFRESGLTVYDCMVRHFQAVPEVKTRPPGSIGVSQEKPSEVGAEERIDINRADALKLTRLPGIGDTLAGRIVKYRTEHGPFRSADDLLLVKGISGGVLEKIRDRISVE